MKKIMFNDKYGLTASVLSGKKNMTRRAVPIELLQKYGHNKFNDRSKELIFAAPFRIDEIVAVAQSYKSIFEESLSYALPKYHWLDDHIDEKGFANKMFVKASEMPHRIRITDIKVERLQDISDEDCLKEGIGTPGILKKWTFFGTNKTWNTRREAFAALIDKVGGKGMWERNPWVFAYTFELERRARP